LCQGKGVSAKLERKSAKERDISAKLGRKSAKERDISAKLGRKSAKVEIYQPNRGGNQPK